MALMLALLKKISGAADVVLEQLPRRELIYVKGGFLTPSWASPQYSHRSPARKTTSRRTPAGIEFMTALV